MPPRALLSLMLALALTASAAPAMSAATRRPSQLRHHPTDEDEASLNRRRTEWLEQIHRAAPGDDWRAMEAANRMEAILRRGGMPKLSGGPWTEQGAMNTTGRNWVARVSRVDPNRLYVGSDNGGVFSGDVAGSGGWSAITDDLGYGVGEMAVTTGGTPGVDGMVIGDRSGRLHVTTNGGATWSVPSGIPDYVWTVRRLLVDESVPTRVYALVDGWTWTGSAWDHSWHLMRSTNGGLSFTTVRTDPIGTIPDIWLNRNTGGALYLMVNGILLRSSTFGSSFLTIGSIPGGASRSVLTGSEAGAPTLYAALETGGAWQLHRSSDAGASWSPRAALSDFYGTLCASRTNASLVLAGGIDCYRSLDGGGSFNRLNHWYEYYDDPLNFLHADIFGIHSLMVPAGATAGAGVIPSGAFEEVLYLDTDGGTYRLLPTAAATPVNISASGFPNAQYYGIRTSLTGPRVVSAGSQDQGYQVSNPASGVALPDFTQIISGDYGHLTSANPTNDMVWSVYPGFILLQVTESQSPDHLELPDFPTDDGISFLPFILANPDNASQVLFCARHIWRVTRTAPTTYSYVMDPTDFDAGAGDYVTALAIAPTDHARWIAATAQGRLYYSTDAGTSWTQSTSAGPQSHYFYGTAILVSPTNPLRVYVGGAGYSGPAVYRSIDGGETWFPQADGLEGTLVFGLEFDNDATQTVYAACESGPYRFNALGGAWESLLFTDCCAPLTSYWDVESLPNHHTMRFATYGRGIWDFDTGSLVSALTPTAAEGVRLAISPNPARFASTLSFDQPLAGAVTIEVFDVQGHRVATPLAGWRPAGRTELRFEHRAGNGRRLESGIYLVRVRSLGGIGVAKLMIAK